MKTQKIIEDAKKKLEHLADKQQLTDSQLIFLAIMELTDEVSDVASQIQTLRINL